MFQPHSNENNRIYFAAIIGLLLLSGTALSITIWSMVDLGREQAIVADLLPELPSDARESMRFLEGELRWQFRLTALVILNVVVTGIAIVLLWRAYHQSQLSLRSITALASDVLDSMEQGVLTTDLSGNLISVNQKSETLLNLPLSAIGHPLESVTTTPLAAILQEWADSQSSENPREFTVGNHGDIRTMRVTCSPLTDHLGHDMGTVLQVRDVTESKWIEQRMRRMERYMGLGSLAAGLHHEIKNPLAALSLHVQLLEENLDTEGTSDENRQTLGVIRSELSRIGGVLESFRDFASIGQLDLRHVNLNELVERQVSLLRPQAQSRMVKIQVDASPAISFVYADAGHLEQALLNLMVNALDAMPDGGVLTIVTRQESPWTIIEVCDTGHGIAKDLQDKILDPYFSTKANGTGLGLALCDKFAREHSGSLDFITSGEGTRFRLSLPNERTAVKALQA